MTFLTETCAKILRRIERFDPSLVDNDHSRAKHLHFGKNMRRDENGVVAAKVADQVPHKADLIWVEADRGLVEDKEIRFVNHGVSETHPLTVTFGEAGYHLFFHILETAKFEHIADAFPQSSPRDSLQ